jgi:hypothetical protein
VDERADEAPRRLLVAQQRLDLGAQLRVRAALRVEERRALARRQLGRPLEHLFDPLPAFVIHKRSSQEPGVRRQ